MSRKLIAALTVMVVWAFAAHGEDRRAVQLSAALNLAENGIRTGKVGPILTAREMLADLAPSGEIAAHLKGKWEFEARFLARGNPVILDRLNAVKDKESDPTLWIYDYSRRFSLTGTARITSIAPGNGLRLRRIDANVRNFCREDPSRLFWRCNPDLEVTSFEITAKGNIRTGYIILTTEAAE